jgi:hypothetical protein
MATMRLILPSGDPEAIAAGGNRSQYTINLSTPIELPAGREFEAALVKATFPHPGGYNSVIIQLDILQFTPFGGQTAQVLFVADPSPTPSYFKAVQENIAQWVPLRTRSINAISVRLSYGAGLPIPAGLEPSQDYTTIIVVIRERAPQPW